MLTFSSKRRFSEEETDNSRSNNLGSQTANWARLSGLELFPESQIKPPDPGIKTAAPVARDGGGIGSLCWQATNSTLPGFRASGPRVVVKPFGGSRFFATVLRWPNGAEERLQLFADSYSANIGAKRLNRAFAGVRP